MKDEHAAARERGAGLPARDNRGFGNPRRVGMLNTNRVKRFEGSCFENGLKLSVGFLFLPHKQNRA